MPRYGLRPIAPWIGLALLFGSAIPSSAAGSYLVRYTLTRIEGSRETTLARGIRRMVPSPDADRDLAPPSAGDHEVSEPSWSETLRALVHRDAPGLTIADDGRRWTYRWHPTAAPDTTLRFDAEILKDPHPRKNRTLHTKPRMSR